MEIRSLSRLLRQALLAMVGGVALFIAMTSLTLFGLQALYAGRIFPGVEIDGIKLGGVEVNQALLKLVDGSGYARQSSLTLQFQGKIWNVSAADLGISFDPGSTLLNAYVIGRYGTVDRRAGDLIKVLSGKHTIPPVYQFNQKTAYQYLENLSRQINQPTREAELVIQGAQIVAIPGQSGYFLDIPTSMDLITNHLQQQGGGILPLVVHESQPEVMDASAYAAAAQAILSSPLTLTVPGGIENTSKSWRFNPEELAAMLSFNRVKSDNGTTYEVKFNEQILNNILLTIGAEFNRSAENPRFIFNDDTRQLEMMQPGVTGRTLNIVRSITAIQNGVKEGKQSIALEFDLVEPAVKNDDAGESLGIRELVHSEVSYFYGSSKERVQNIQTAASRFHGLLIAPGEFFSMARAMGDVSLNNGYAEALIIFNGQTIQGVGGGVCQVSTALFRAAFFSGLPITERHPHAYRVKYYEKEYGNRLNSRLAGLDATVYVPVVDLKFTNDTPYWLLMETYVSPQNNTLTWKFYSTKDGRRVEWKSSGPTNLVESPKPLYRENVSLKKGEIEQVDWEAQGADVFVTRLVHNADNSIRFQDNFNTHYEPWRAIYEYGPGTEGIPNFETP